MTMPNFAVYVDDRYKGMIPGDLSWGDEFFFKSAKNHYVSASQLIRGIKSQRIENKRIYIYINPIIDKEGRKVMKFEAYFRHKYQGPIEGFDNSDDEYLIKQVRETYVHEKLAPNEVIVGRVDRTYDKIYLWVEIKVDIESVKKKIKKYLAPGFYDVLYNGKHLGQIYFCPQWGGEQELCLMAKKSLLNTDKWLNKTYVTTYVNGNKVHIVNLNEIDDEPDQKDIDDAVLAEIWGVNPSDIDIKLPEEKIELKELKHPMLSYD